ncbi:hypothetical protein [Nisaea sediminum]|uniref:hypothetical protein n=1 Tax=Nisaea sediminum TaxID=2775867 RepID=UPI001867A3ED|nr:hypothetical protein [Nisaea sediminum]
MKSNKTGILAALVVAFLVAFSAGPASAAMPSEEERDILIVSTLLRFNDANLSGNYSLFREMASLDFQNKNSEQDIARAFASFRQEGVNIEEVAVREILPDEDGETVHDGVLRLSGEIELSRFRMTYLLRFQAERGVWRLYSIDVDLRQ